MAIGPHPPASFGACPLVTRAVPAGAVWRRLFETRHTNPLGFDLAKSRFSYPRGRGYGVVYLGSSIRVAVHEVILRDQGDARTGQVLLSRTELESYTCAEVAIEMPLKLAPRRVAQGMERRTVFGIGHP